MKPEIGKKNKSDIFISYEHRDKAYAERYNLEFEALNCNCSFQPKFSTAKKYQLEINQSISECKVFLILISNNMLGSKWVQSEYLQAVDSNKIVLPVYLEDVNKNKLRRNYPGLPLINGISKGELEETDKLIRFVKYHFPRRTNLRSTRNFSDESTFNNIKKLIKSEKYTIALEKISNLLSRPNLSLIKKKILHRLSYQIHINWDQGALARDHLWALREIYLHEAKFKKIVEIDRDIIHSILEVDSKDWRDSAEEYNKFLSRFPDSIQIGLLSYIVAQIHLISLENNESTKVIDLCCGTGMLSHLVVRDQLNLSVTGYDIQDMIKIGNNWLQRISLNRAYHNRHEFIPIKALFSDNIDKGFGFFDVGVMNMAIFQFGLREKYLLLNKFTRNIKIGGKFWLSTDAPDFEFPSEKIKINPSLSETNPFKQNLLDVLREIGYPQKLDVKEATKPTFKKDTLDSIRYLLEMNGFKLLTKENNLPIISFERTGEERLTFTSIPVISRKVLKRELPSAAWKNAQTYLKNWKDNIFGTVLLSERNTVPAKYIFIQSPAPPQTTEEIVFAASAVLIGENNRILLVKRGALSSLVRDYPMTWSLPSSMARPSKALTTTLEDSILLHLGIECKDLKPLAIRIVLKEKYNELPSTLFVMNLFEGHIKSKPKLKDKKYIDSRWVKPQEILGVEPGPEGMGECIYCLQDVIKSGW